MTGARLRTLAGLSAILAGLAIGVAVVGREARPVAPRAVSERPAILLLTSLPLVFPEQFTLKEHGSPALAALQTRYRVVPIDVSGAKALANARLLLMAHPAAQRADDLVALDDWVRRGGRVLLLADPMLEWPSSRPLGDPLRPSPMFMDTGLLHHWGLALDAPDVRGPQRLHLAGRAIMTDSPGRVTGRCTISADALVAHCRIGRGRATIIADADFLDVNRLGQPAKHNLGALLSELAQLEES